MPLHEVSQHKYTAKGGLSELCRDVGGPNVKKFFGGWLSFIRMAMGAKGKLAFLANVPKQPGTRRAARRMLCAILYRATLGEG